MCHPAPSPRVSCVTPAPQSVLCHPAPLEYPVSPSSTPEHVSPIHLRLASVTESPKALCHPVTLDQPVSQSSPKALFVT